MWRGSCAKITCWRSSRGLLSTTTDSHHELEVYLNLARRMKLTGINQLWVADITYIRLQREFVYLAVILDAFSRKVVGWALDRTLAARLGDRGAGEGDWRSGNRRRVWCITPIAACSMLPATMWRFCGSTTCSRA